MKPPFFRLFYVIVLLYAGINFYAYKKIAAFKSINSAGRLAIALFLCLMVFAHFLTRLMISKGLTAPIVTLSWVSYIWMSFIFLFFFFSLGLDLYRTVTVNANNFLRFNLSAVTLSPQKSTLTAAILALIAVGYGFFAARQINMEQVTIQTTLIEKKNNPLRIVQISDLHTGMMTDKDHFKKIVKAIESIPGYLI